MTLPPRATCMADESSLPVLHDGARRQVRRRDLAPTDHLLAVAATMPCTRSTKAQILLGVSFCTSSPPMWKYGAGTMAAISRTTSLMNV